MSGIIAHERKLNDIADWFEQEYGDCGDLDGWAVHTDDVDARGVFVMGQGQCGRIPVDDLYFAVRKANRSSDRGPVESLVVRHVG